MAAAMMKGNIEEYVSTTSSKTTKNLQEIFSLLDQPAGCKQSRIILVEGSPGVGKSVLLKHISYLWAQDELFTSSNVLFLLCLRDPAVQQINSLNDLVHHFYRHNKSAADHCIAELLQDDGKFLTMLLDGYDELPLGLQQTSFIAEILQRKVLTACAIVISSRPHASTKLRSNVTCRVEILGFSEEDQRDFIEQSLEKQPHKIPMLDEYLKAHPVIASLCYIPFYMTVLLFLYIQEIDLPTSSTELYNLFICLTICRHLTKSGVSLQEDMTDLNRLPQPYNKIINQLSKLAFTALEKNQLVFTLAEIKEECPEIGVIPGAINGFGLLQAVEYVRITCKTVSLNFLHFSVQEFLAANYVSNLPPDEEFLILQDKFWERNYLHMFRFYIALTKGQRQSFRRFLSGGNEAIVIDDKFTKNSLKSVWLYQCFSEAADDQMCSAIENKFSDGMINFPGTKLSADDIEATGILLTSSSIKQWQWLNLGGYHIRDAGIMILHRLLPSSYITIEELWLHRNDLSSSSDSYLTDIVVSCGVKQLDINSNKNIGQTEKFFPNILSHPSSMLERLEIAGINLSSQVAIKIFAVLKGRTKLKELGMANNKVTDEAHHVMTEALQVNCTLKRLDIYGNRITGEVILLILTSLCKQNNTLEDLRLPCNYTEGTKKKIILLEEAINETRRRHKCQVKLDIKFNR